VANLGSGGFREALNFEALSARLRFMLMEDASETQEEEVEMMDYDNPEDHILERKLDEDHRSATGSAGTGGSGAGAGGGGSGGGGSGGSASGLPSGLRQPGSRMGNWGASFARNVMNRNWRKFKLTFMRMFITVVIGVCIGLTGFAVSKSVNAMIRANMHVLSEMMNKDRPAAAFFIILFLSCIYTAVAAFFVTFGSWQTRGSGVGRLNAYLSGMSSSRFLALKTLFVKIFGLILTVAAGIKQGMEGPFIHIGAMVGLHVSRLLIFLTNLVGGRCGVTKYTSIVAGVVDERMFISGGAAAGFSVAFNAPIAGVLYVQDGAFAYWQGEYTLRTFLCTMTAVTTLNLCFKQGEELPSRGLIDIDFARTTIVLQEFGGFFILGILGGLMGILFTKINVAVEKFRHKWVGKARLPNVIDVLACTVMTVLLSFILPFMLGCHARWPEDSCDFPDRCLQFHCGPQRYSDLATFFFTLPEETIRILFDRKTSVEAHIPYQTLLVFCVFYFLMAAISYGMAVPGGLFIPSIIIGASYGRLVGLAVQSILTSNTPAGETPPLIIPGVYAVLGSASMLGGVTRMTLPITVMMIEVTSDAQFLIPIMLCVRRLTHAQPDLLYLSFSAEAGAHRDCVYVVSVIAGAVGKGRC
jgi:H+/Cl- antiporter ClcA